MPLGSPNPIGTAMGVPAPKGPTTPSYTQNSPNYGTLIAPAATPSWYTPQAWSTSSTPTGQYGLPTSLASTVNSQLAGLTQQGAAANASDAAYQGVLGQNYGAQQGYLNQDYAATTGLLANGYTRDVTQAQQYLNANQQLDQSTYARQLAQLQGQYGFANQGFAQADSQALLNYYTGVNNQSTTDQRAKLAYDTGVTDNGIGVDRAQLQYNTGLTGVGIAGQQSALSNNQRLAQLLGDATNRGATTSRGYGQGVGFSNSQLGIENQDQANQRTGIQGNYDLSNRDLANQLGNIKGTYGIEQGDSANQQRTLTEQLGLDRSGNQLNLDKTNASLNGQVGDLNDQNAKTNLDYQKQQDYIGTIASDYGIRGDQANTTLQRGLQALGFDFTSTMKQLTDAQGARNASQAATAANIVNQAMQIGATLTAGQQGPNSTPYSTAPYLNGTTQGATVTTGSGSQGNMPVDRRPNVNDPTVYSNGTGTTVRKVQ